MADIDGLIAKGAKALIILAMDKDAIIPALAKAKAKNIPVVAYDRLIEQPGVFYITFDNKEVGRMQARAVLAAKPKGNYVMIKGSPTDPNADFLRAGQQEVLADAIKKGDIKIVGDEYTEGWKPEVAQKNMEQILTKNSNKVDAVVASNDGMAGGVVAALSARGLKGVPVSGQDGDHAALNRVALGTQTVSVWKDSRDLGREAANAAILLAQRQEDRRLGHVGRGREEGPDERDVPQGRSGHPGQSRRPDQGRSHHQGSRLQGRGAGHRTGRLQVTLPRAGSTIVAVRAPRRGSFDGRGSRT